jgi:hypothetical protein
LQNPNLVVRYHAYNSLHQFGKKSVSSLESLWNSDADPAMRARAFWSLVKMPAAKADKYIKQALKEKNPQLRMLGHQGKLAAQRQYHWYVLNALKT